MTLKALYEVLYPGMIVFDIGAEQGEFSAMAAKIVGGENVHLFEPSERYWPNIKRIWDYNKFNIGGCFQGFVSNYSDHKENNFSWPECSNGEIFTDTAQLLQHSSPNIPTISIDEYCKAKNISPDVLMIDCEGAEVNIIEGAKKTLINKPTIVFVSVHSDQEILNHGRERKELFNMFDEFGYKYSLINKDHEEHWIFTKK
jgi:FkbM family methyltransferase